MKEEDIFYQVPSCPCSAPIRTYDSQGRAVTMTYATGHQELYTYDSAGNMYLSTRWVEITSGHKPAYSEVSV